MIYLMAYANAADPLICVISGFGFLKAAANECGSVVNIADCTELRGTSARHIFMTWRPLELAWKRIFLVWKRFEGLWRGLEAARTLVWLRKRS